MDARRTEVQTRINFKHIHVGHALLCKLWGFKSPSPCTPSADYCRLHQVPEPRQVGSVLRAAGRRSRRTRTRKSFPESSVQLQWEAPQRWCDLNNSFNRQRLEGLRWQLSLVTRSNYHLLPADKRQFSANWVLSQWNCQSLTFRWRFGGGTGAVWRLQRWRVGVLFFFFCLTLMNRSDSEEDGWLDRVFEFAENTFFFFLTHRRKPNLSFVRLFPESVCPTL